MANPGDLVTVFRSADPSASDDAAAVVDLLAEAGLNPAMFNEDAPGVPEGAYEVRVPADEEPQAIQAMTEAWGQPDEGESDDSHAQDLVILYEGMGTNAEVEAMGIRAVLDASDIPSVLVGASPYPNLPLLVKVPRSIELTARQVLAEAQQAGPSAAEEAAEKSSPSE